MSPGPELGTAARRSRFVKKNGQCNVVFNNEEDKPRRYLADISPPVWTYNAGATCHSSHHHPLSCCCLLDLLGRRAVHGDFDSSL
ncbi:ATP-sensitive inward rectifier potassium channel 12-like protein [Lates japonicus]|uniref:ATP-sensitive inward rectifier potassium channel 12-like protein n=1 Tax=Lates japonicus TaxID=270547 RepID=A0AAD3RJJ7_LATJO|nr:ATP-sensitive inward rectifier potassium channel 12-like protein [Lates japonicus]